MRVATYPRVPEAAVLHTPPRPRSGLQTPSGNGSGLPPVQDPAVFASAVALPAGLREFRQSLYECLKARADTMFELTNAVLCTDHAVIPPGAAVPRAEVTRGHGTVYDARFRRRIGGERCFSRLESELPQAVDWPESLAWIAEHDVIDHGMLEKLLSGLPQDDASQMRDARPVEFGCG